MENSMHGGGEKEQAVKRRRGRQRRRWLIGACALPAIALLTLATGWTSAAQRHGGARAAFVVEGEKLVPAEVTGEAHIGRSVALSADGNTALVGGPHDDNEAGAAYVFVRTGSTWTEQARLAVGLSEGSRFFGRSVALSADGSTAVVGDPGNGANVGAAWVFTRSGSTWTRQAKLAGGGEEGPGQFGRSVSVSQDGSVALVGAWRDAGDIGAVWTFVRAGTTWTQQGGKLTGEGEEGHGWFGRGVAISADGSEAMVGASNDAHGTGAAWAYARTGGGWEQQGPKLTGGGESGAGQFGESVTLSGDGSTALVGGPNDASATGAAWAFTRSGATWTQQGAKLTGADEVAPGTFGYSVSLSGDGSTAIAGGYTDDEKAGAAWLFAHTGASWEQEGAKLTGPGEVGPGRFGFGATLSADGNTALVGAITDDGGLGAAWVFARPAPVEPPPPEEPVPTTTTETVSAPVPPTQTGSSAVLAGTSVSAPVLAVTGNIAPVSGRIRLRLPHTKEFVVLPGLRQIPYGTVIDATEGRVVVTAASAGTGTQNGEFFSGEFELTQTHSGIVTATLAGGSTSSCKRGKHGRHRKRKKGHRASATASARHHGRKLWSNAHGTFSTKGNYAAGAVQGTEWLTEDRCDGTYIRVTRDKVLVTDLVHHRSTVVRAGHSILVRTP
jgi:hypothetical protein